MDVKAILIVEGGAPDGSSGSPAETVAGIPIAYLDVLGLPVLQHLLHRLRRFGVLGVTLISGSATEADPLREACCGALRIAPGASHWRTALASCRGSIPQVCGSGHGAGA